MRLFGLDLSPAKRLDHLQETITSLNRQLEDVGWINLGNPQHGSQLYLPGNLFEVIATCRRLWIRSPLAGHWERLMTAFVFGYGISNPKAVDPNVQKVIDAFWDDPDNIATLTGAQAQWQLSAKGEYEGNLFFVLLKNPATGQVKVRIADTATITDVICSPQDQTRRLFFRRQVLEKKYNFASDAYTVATPKIMYYPDMSIANPEEFNVPPNKLAENAVIFHARLNCDINDKYGLPPMLRGLDWIKAHKEMASDMQSLISALARFAWKKRIEGSPAQVQGIKANNQAKSDRSNPAPTAGSTYVSNKGVDLDAINIPTGGAIIHREGLKAMVLQVAAAAGFGEQYFGDVSTGNLATAKTMELPLLKGMQMRQEFWVNVYDTILQYVIDCAVEAGELSGTVEFMPEENRNKVSVEFDRTIDIDFPPLTEEDFKPLVEAMQIAKEQGFIDKDEAARQVMMSRQVNDIEQHLKLIDQQEAERKQNELDKSKMEFAAKGLPVPPDAGGSNGNGFPNRMKASAPTQEAIEMPSRAKAVSMADKTAKVLGKMEAYRKELARAYRVFGARVKQRMDLVGPEGSQKMRVRDLKDALSKLGDDMQHAASVFFPQAIDLGRQYVRAHVTDPSLLEGFATKLKEARTTEEQLIRDLRWNRQYVEESLLPDIEDALQTLGDEALTSASMADGLLAEKLGSFDSRIGAYASAFWAVEEQAVQNVGAAYDMQVNFVGADDGGTCESCQRGLEGNPWAIVEAPRPGLDTQCLTNCRHALQIIEQGAG